MIFCSREGCTTEEPTTGNSLLCDTCRDRVHDDLRWVEFHAANLTPVKKVRPEMVATAAGFSSAPPLDLHAVAQLDPRSNAVGVHRVHTGPEDDDHPPLSVPAVLGGWAQQVWEDRTPPSLRHLVPAPHTVRDAISTLLVALGWVSEQPWVLDLADEVRQLRRELAVTNGEAPPKPVASCTRREGDPPTKGQADERPACGGGIVIREQDKAGVPFVVGARCLSCGTVYSGFEVIRLARANKALRDNGIR
ncbi:hypothetical protein ACVDFE_02185 [Lentzea chajnantorensis]